MIISQFNNVETYWNGMVVPDFEAFRDQRDDLRFAYHAASSLFHVHDWIWSCHSFDVQKTFGVKPGKRPSDGAKAFSGEIAATSRNFEIVRSVANAGKHLALDKASSSPYVASNAANNAVTTVGYGIGPYGSGLYGQTVEVTLEGTPNVPFFPVAEDVFNMWRAMILANGWAKI